MEMYKMWPSTGDLIALMCVFAALVAGATSLVWWLFS